MNFEGLVKFALKLMNCLNFKAFICMYSEMKSGLSSGSTVIFCCFRKPTPSPPAVVSSISSCQTVYQGSGSSTSCSGTNSNSSSAMCVQGSQACNKEAWPSLQPGLTTNSNTNGLYDINDTLLGVFLNFCIYLNVRQLYCIFSELEKEWPSLILG